VSFPVRFKNCFGFSSVDNGQNLVPLPPAIISAHNIKSLLSINNIFLFPSRSFLCFCERKEDSSTLPRLILEAKALAKIETQRADYESPTQQLQEYYGLRPDAIFLPIIYRYIKL